MKTKGSVLIIVLWSLFILSALAVAASGYVRAQISVADKLSQNTRTYYLARAGVEKAIFELINAPVKAYDAPNDSCLSPDASFKDVKFGDGSYSVAGLCADVKDTKEIKYGLSDEESKINVNSAPLSVLKNLFETAAGKSPEEANSIAASIVNWRNPPEKAVKDGAKEFYYQTLDHPYKCKCAPIEILEELLLIKGITKDIFDRIRYHVTVYGAGQVNINTADKIVLRSLGISEELADKIGHFRLDNVFDDTSKIAAVLKEKESISETDAGKINNLISSSLLSVNSDNFSASATGKTGSGAQVKIAFIFDRKNRALRYWRE